MPPAGRTPTSAENDASLWELSVDMLATSNLAGYLTRVSPGWETVLGYTAEELLSRPYVEFVHPDDVERTAREASALLEPGHATVSFENRWRAKDGTYRWFAWNSRTSLDGATVYGVVRDVTAAREAAREREALVKELKQRELMLSGVIANSTALIYVKDLNGCYLLYNGPFADAFGLEARGAVEGVSGLDVLLGRDDVWLDPELQSVWRENDLRAAEKTIAIKEWSDHPELGRLTYDSTKFPLLDAQGQVYATCGVSQETTEHVRAIASHKEAEERFRGAFEFAPIGMALVDCDQAVMRANDALCRITGYAPEDLVGRSLREMIDPEDVEESLEGFARLVEGAVDASRQELRMFNASGHTVWVLSSWSAIRDEAGEIVHFIVQVEDISERKRLEERLRRVADQDSLTGARTRRLFEEDLLTQLGRCRRYGEQAALLVLDVDSFKQVNDRHGHKTGDDVLKAIVQTLSQRLRSTDRIARLGGDEFAVLLPHIGPAQAHLVADALRAALAATTVEADGVTVTATASIGIALIDESTEDVDAVLAEADHGMYADKRASNGHGSASDGRGDAAPGPALASASAKAHPVPRRRRGDRTTAR